MASHECLLADALNLDRGRMSNYCKTVNPAFLDKLNREKPSTMAALAEIWYTSNGASGGRTQRYNMVASPFIVIPCSSQSCSILLRTAVTVFMTHPPLPD